MSNKSEQQIARSIGAKPHKNSGRGMKKGDASDDVFVIDIKEASKSFTLNEAVWNKICTDAYKVNPFKAPQLLVVLGIEHKRRLSIIESDVLLGLQETAKRYAALLEEVEEEAWFRDH